MEQKTERHRACAVCVENGKLLVVSLRDPLTKRLYLFPPGGAVEKNETAAEAATRETLEETGFSVAIVADFATTIRYDFTWEGRIFDCQTTFFAAKRLDLPQAEVRDRSYHEGVSWLPLPEIEPTFAFHPAIRDAIVAVIHAAGL